ncbi:unnamed protein product [Schistocephalus solidus]|uniref:RRM domain-containing protein n=1 Tax=Schistocephalus solidus TaxID=70667 RepID=A0A183SGV5_SCHSO|nr:unnamed protein product [Schistocephalus solidus]
MQKPQLEAIFSKFGAIIGISVHKGYAFIQYANEAHARAAVKAEDMNTYYGMKLDVTIASEPKNRKRGRPAATQNACTSAQNFLDLALQAQALAAVGGQFSHLGFSNNTAPPLSLAASQYPAAAAAAAAAAANLTGLIPAMNVMNSGVPPLLGQASIGGGGGGAQKSPSGIGYKSLMPNPHRGSGLNSLSASSSSAKRTRLETGSSGGGGGGSANSSGLPAGAAAARSANLVSLVTPKQDPFPPTTRANPRTSAIAASPPSLSLTSRLQSAISRSNAASNSHSNNSTQKYTHGIAAKFSDMKVGGGQEADRRQNSNGSARCDVRVKKTGGGRGRRWLARPEPSLGVPPQLDRIPQSGSASDILKLTSHMQHRNHMEKVPRIILASLSAMQTESMYF